MKAWNVHQKYGDATAIVFAETAGKPKRQHLQQKISGAVTFWMLKYTVSPALTNSTHPEKPKWTGATRRTE